MPSVKKGFPSNHGNFDFNDMIRCSSVGTVNEERGTWIAHLAHEVHGDFTCCLGGSNLSLDLGFLLWRELLAPTKASLANSLALLVPLFVPECRGCRQVAFLRKVLRWDATPNGFSILHMSHSGNEATVRRSRTTQIRQIHGDS